MTGARLTVLILAGGPDAERDVSIDGASAAAAALRAAGRFDVRLEVIDRPGPDELRALPGDVVFPLLHGRWGEGGPLQELLEQDGRPFVGCRAAAARTAMDKVLTKSIAANLGISTTPTAVFEPVDGSCPLPLPVVLKPIHEGSTIGLHVCRSEDQWLAARRAAAAANRPYMIEPYIAGREVTQGVVDGAALPLIEIIPAGGLYDYQAKYVRDDTGYVVDPRLPADAAARIAEQSMALARSIGATPLCRIDWIVADNGRPLLLEVNTMPGFTSHSLVPMAAAAATGPGLDLAALCTILIEAALRQASPARV